MTVPPEAIPDADEIRRQRHVAREVRLGALIGGVMNGIAIAYLLWEHYGGERGHGFYIPAVVFISILQLMWILPTMFVFVVMKRHHVIGGLAMIVGFTFLLNLVFCGVIE